MVSVTRRRMTPDEEQFVRVLLDAHSGSSRLGLRVGCAIVLVTASAMPVLLVGYLGRFYCHWTFWITLAAVDLAFAFIAVALDASSHRRGRETRRLALEALEAGTVDVTRYQAAAVVKVAIPEWRDMSWQPPRQRGTFADYYYDIGDGKLLCLEGVETEQMPNNDFEHSTTANGLAGFRHCYNGMKLVPVRVLDEAAARPLWGLRLPSDREIFDGSLETLEEDLRRYSDQHQSR